MPLLIVRNDITKMEVDAIVNAANSSLLGGGGVDGCIHRAAGPELLAECRTLHGCPAGEARLTGGYRLPARYVIHTVGPVWQGGHHQEKELLTSCYRSSLALARDNGCRSVAFPLISAGIYGYPREQALKVAVDTIGEFLLENEMTVYLVIFDRASFQISEQLFADVAQYIDDNYAAEHDDTAVRRLQSPGAADFNQTAAAPQARRPKGLTGGLSDEGRHHPCSDAKSESLEQMLAQIDESFSEMLLRKITEKGMSDAECYKKANIDRKLFSKIRSNPHYQPSKPTAAAFAVALQLSMAETRELLMKAGYALSRSSRFDLVITYFIEHRQYNIFEINEVLFRLDQQLLGAS